MSKPKPPKHLADTGAALWREVVEKWDLRADELRILSSACVAADMEAEFIKAWGELGRPYMSKGSMGQEVEHRGPLRLEAPGRGAVLLQQRLEPVRSGAVEGVAAAERVGGVPGGGEDHAVGGHQREVLGPVGAAAGRGDQLVEVEPDDRGTLRLQPPQGLVPGVAGDVDLLADRGDAVGQPAVEGLGEAERRGVRVGVDRRGAGPAGARRR